MEEKKRRGIIIRAYGGRRQAVKTYTFKRATSKEYGWHPDLQGGDVPIDRLTVPGGGGQGRYSEWFWFDGEFDDGY
jgi:hypothetical protein